jgi:glycosyltransferase involved in cell wall biosynthesis
VVINNVPNKHPYSHPSSNPHYAGYLRDHDSFDITILHNDPEFHHRFRKKTKKLYFLPNDVCPRPMTQEEIASFDNILWLSQYQRAHWVSINPELKKFTNIFGNGIQPQQFDLPQIKPNPYSCIYASDYSRGLHILLNSWPNIKKAYPKATLDLYYGLRNWGETSKEKEESIRSAIHRLKPLDVVDHGMVGHEELAAAFAKSSFWTYPCIFNETFCITALKAQASGAIPVIIDGFALKETVRSGYKCEHQNQYEHLLLKAMSQVETISAEQRKSMRDFVFEHFTWEVIVHRWNELFI